MTLSLECELTLHLVQTASGRNSPIDESIMSDEEEEMPTRRRDSSFLSHGDPNKWGGRIGAKEDKVTPEGQTASRGEAEAAAKEEAPAATVAQPAPVDIDQVTAILTDAVKNALLVNAGEGERGAGEVGPSTIDQSRLQAAVQAVLKQQAGVQGFAAAAAAQPNEEGGAQTVATPTEETQALAPEDSTTPQAAGNNTGGGNEHGETNEEKEGAQASSEGGTLQRSVYSLYGDQMRNLLTTDSESATATEQQSGGDQVTQDTSEAESVATAEVTPTATDEATQKKKKEKKVRVMSFGESGSSVEVGLRGVAEEGIEAYYYAPTVAQGHQRTRLAWLAQDEWREEEAVV